MNTFNAKIYRQGREEKPTEMLGFEWDEIVEVLASYQSTTFHPLVRVEIVREVEPEPK